MLLKCTGGNGRWTKATTLGQKKMLPKEKRDFTSLVPCKTEPMTVV